MMNENRATHGGYVLICVLILFVVLSVGCTSPQARLDMVKHSIDVASACHARVSIAKQRGAGQGRVPYKDARDEALVIMAKALAGENSESDWAQCNRIAEAAVRYSQNQDQVVTNATFGLARGVLWLGGAAIAADAITDLAGSNNETNTFNNSRVVQDGSVTNGGSISASGEGLGIGNSVNSDGLSQGGLQPRQAITQVSGDGATSDGESLSGTNAPITGGDNLPDQDNSVTGEPEAP